MNRDEAWTLVCEWTTNENLRNHMLGVEAAMRWYAQKFGEDEDTWGMVGLLHDFDWERHQDSGGHPEKGCEMLRQKGCPDNMIRAILSHAHWTGVPRDTLMAKGLFACDELVGFLVACALVQPNKSLHEVKLKSVKRKLKDKSFARGVNRVDILQGVEEVEVELDNHIMNVLEALRGIAGKLGLD